MSLAVSPAVRRLSLWSHFLCRVTMARHRFLPVHCASVMQSHICRSNSRAWTQEEHRKQTEGVYAISEEGRLILETMYFNHEKQRCVVSSRGSYGGPSEVTICSSIVNSLDIHLAMAPVLVNGGEGVHSAGVELQPSHEEGLMGPSPHSPSCGPRTHSQRLGRKRPRPCLCITWSLPLRLKSTASEALARGATHRSLCPPAGPPGPGQEAALLPSRLATGPLPPRQGRDRSGGFRSLLSQLILRCFKSGTTKIIIITIIIKDTSNVR